MNANGTRHVVVEPDGTGVVAHLELHALGSFADRLGLGDSPSARIPMTGERLPIHDRGKVFAQLPTSIASGHRAGDDSALTNRSLVVRADSAGCTEGFLSACRARNVRFFVTARSNPQVTAAIGDAIGIDQVWEPSRTQQGGLRDGAAVCELTSLVKDDKLPPGTRLIVRREPLHPGAQRSLFPSLDFRYWGFYTDAEGSSVELDTTMRAHAHVEQHIQRLKDSGLCRFPFTNFEANANWMMAVGLAADLVRWFQLLCMDGSWVNARPKTLRWGIFHAPGRLIHRSGQHVVRIVE